MKFLELQKKDLDEVHNLASGFYDAIRRGGTGLQQFFSSQAQGIGRTLFSNAFTEGYKAIGSPSAGGLIPGQVGADGQLTAIGRILQGTPFGTNGKDAQSKTADNTLRTAIGVERLVGRLSGKDPGAAGSSSGSGEGGAEGIGLPTDGSPGDWASEVSGGAKVIAALAGASGYGGFMGSLGRFAQPGQGVGAVMDAITGDSGDSGAQRAGVLVGAGTAAATGITGVIQGIDQGGARGTLGAVGAGAATVAAFDPEPISKSILASVAAGSALIAQRTPRTPRAG